MAPRVFISYAHQDDVRDAVSTLAASLRACGVDARIDRYESRLDWSAWMEEQADEATHVLCVCSERYLRRWKGERAGGGVEFEASLLRVLRRRAQEKCIPLFFEPVSADHLRLVPPAITADPVILRSATFSPHDLPVDARRLLATLCGYPEEEMPPLGPALSPEVLQSEGVRAPRREALSPDDRAGHRRRTLDQLRHAIQIDRDKQWRALEERTDVPRLAACLFGTRENALHLFSRRMGAELDGVQHKLVPFPNVGFERPSRRPGDWRRTVMDVLATPRGNLRDALAYATCDARLSLFFGPIPPSVQDNLSVEQGFAEFLEADLAPAVRDLDARRRMWVVFCLELARPFALPAWGGLVARFAEAAGIPHVSLPETKLPEWERDIELFLTLNGVPQDRWGPAFGRHRRLMAGEGTLDELFEMLDSLVEGS